MTMRSPQPSAWKLGQMLRWHQPIQLPAELMQPILNTTLGIDTVLGFLQMPLKK